LHTREEYRAGKAAARWGLQTADIRAAVRASFEHCGKSLEPFPAAPHGDADRILPIAATGKRTHELIKGSKLVVVEGGPHGITWTHSQQVNQGLMEFLGEKSQLVGTTKKSLRNNSAT